jgi:hypothetical protein
METTATIIGLLLVFLAGAIWAGKPPKAYAARSCMGRHWKTAFPNSPNAEIRRFLRLFVEAFAFKDQYKLHFKPSDRILDIYNAATGKRGSAGCRPGCSDRVQQFSSTRAQTWQCFRAFCFYSLGWG